MVAPSKTHVNGLALQRQAVLPFAASVHAGHALHVRGNRGHRVAAPGEPVENVAMRADVARAHPGHMGHRLEMGDRIDLHLAALGEAVEHLVMFIGLRLHWRRAGGQSGRDNQGCFEIELHLLSPTFKPAPE
jgi:hypothetical protein